MIMNKYVNMYFIVIKSPLQIDGFRTVNTHTHTRKRVRTKTPFNIKIFIQNTVRGKTFRLNKYLLHARYTENYYCCLFS